MSQYATAVAGTIQYGIQGEVDVVAGLLVAVGGRTPQRRRHAQNRLQFVPQCLCHPDRLAGGGAQHRVEHRRILRGADPIAVQPGVDLDGQLGGDDHEDRLDLNIEPTRSGQELGCPSGFVP